MITREDAKDGILEYYNVFRDLDWQIQDMLKEGVDNRIDEIYDSLEQHIKSLEAKLANTEQLTCETCSYFSWDGIGIGQCHNCSPQCPRYTLTDFGCIFYTKDTK